jgi:hypothetical protein
MKNELPHKVEATNDIPLGWVEPHAQLLKQPENTQRLYKIVRAHHFLDMLQKNYLHFQRVDTYRDDTFDGEQLPLDKERNQKLAFEKSPSFTAATYYDASRSRTYACCFSLENSSYIWGEYGKGGNALGLAFEFGKLRHVLNQTMESGNSALMYGDNHCKQIFSINYGIVEYVEREKHSLNVQRLANPVQYTFLKEKQKYEGERELRISLSALGIGSFALANGEIMAFPPSLQLDFNFKEAFFSGTIQEILTNGDDSLAEHLKQKMQKLGYMLLECGKPT